jgi:predicted DNA-binding ribbon-helix-helix protein
MSGHEEAMTRLSKRSLLLAGHATSVALEPEFWAVLEEMAAARGESLAGLITRLDEGRGERPLASACRLAALAWARGGA